MARRFLSFLAPAALAFGSLSFMQMHACTEFQITANDSSIVVGRSMEFAVELGTELVVVSRGQEKTSLAPGDKEGLKWKSKYGYVALNAFSLPIVIDGFNENGLSIGFLWLPGSEYQDVKPEDSANALALEDFGAWLLGNFATAGEVKDAVKNVKVWSHTFKQLGGMIPPIHVAVQDSKGASLVIEYTKGELKLYDNPVGVLTNAPTFDWHLANLDNYVNLTPLNAPLPTIGALKITADNQGSGLKGLPGDPLPSSRFVKAAYLKQFAKPPENAKEATVLAGHLLNTVDIPKGTIRVKKDDPNNGDYTQWVVVKDLANKIFYFRAYNNAGWQMVDFKSFDLSPNAKHKSFAIDEPVQPLDVTTSLKG